MSRPRLSLTRVRWTPARMRRLLGIFGPYLGAGVRVEHIAEDWRETRVAMRLRWYNRNIFGTHFGGSLYSMVDPHLALMLLQLLGGEYIVWDKSASIDFVRPGLGTVRATLRVGDEDLAAIRDACASGRPHLHEFDVDIVDEKGIVVATVNKVLYVRLKRGSGAEGGLRRSDEER